LAADLFESPDAPYGVFALDPGAHWMIEYYHAKDVVHADGHVRAKIVGADQAWLVRFALRHAGTVRVIEPAQLAEDVAAAARAALSAYDGTNSTIEE
jgi:proteasome accessory factor C